MIREKRGLDIINPDTGKSIFADAKKESTPQPTPLAPAEVTANQNYCYVNLRIKNRSLQLKQMGLT